MAEIYELPSFQTEINELIKKGKNVGLNLFIVTGTKPNWSEFKNHLHLESEDGQLTNSKWTFYETPNYERLFPNLVKECRNYFLSQFSVQNTNETTIEHFRKLWTHQYLKNKNWIESGNQDVSWFQSFSSDNPNVMFLGASPRLELEIESIKTLRKNFTIFACDTSLGFLLSKGVFPDYIVSFDSGRGTLFHFIMDLPKDIPIITWLGGSPYLFELPNPKILVNTGHPLDQILEHLFQITTNQKWPHYQNSSLNLLGMVLSVTASIKDRNFMMAGVSFISEQGKSHCNGTGYERYYLPQLHRKQSLESFTKRLYTGVRKGKNQIVWDELNNQKEMNKIHFVSELTPFDTNIGSNEKVKVKLHSFQGFPPKISDVAKWANQDPSGIIHTKTINTWLRFSPD
ncbi:6-hydroxymethylpterin diphosphokinase MptE-like protein [Leptospira sp. WS39.C2]